MSSGVRHQTSTSCYDSRPHLITLMSIQMLDTYICMYGYIPSVSEGLCFPAHLPLPIMSHPGDTLRNSHLTPPFRPQGTRLEDWPFCSSFRRENLCIYIFFHAIAPKWLPCSQERISTRIGWQNWDTNRNCDGTGLCCIILVYPFPSLYVCSNGSTITQFKFLKPQHQKDCFAFSSS